MADTIVLGVFILATVFSVGAVLLESLGLLGDWGDQMDAGGGAGDGGGGDSGSEADDGDGGGGGEAGAAGSATGGATAPPREPGAASGAHLAPRLFKLLWYMRLSMFFCLGFGPVGLVATFAGARWVASLAWALPAGLIAGGMTWGLFRLQQREFDSTVHEHELVGRTGQVIISIPPGEFGRVRIELEQLMRERYARADEPGHHIAKGERVRISRVEDGCVYVQPLGDEQEPSTSSASSQ